ELMVAMAVAGIVLMAIYSAYHTQSSMYRTQTVVLNMQQNIRGGLYFMEREIRMAGYDQNDTGNFGITDIRFYDINNSLNSNGNSAITFTSDLNDNGVIDSNETISFSIYDNPVGAPDGILDMARNNGAGRQIIAESIEALFLAYAYDNDGDGRLDTSANGNIIWAFDSDNNNILDRILDTNDDGEIDINDNTAGTSIGGSGVAVSSIKAVKVWLLARTKTAMLKYTDKNTYVVGNRRITPNDNFKRELLVTTIKCRNMGM
ncbi:MAG: PilW family protein, partial [Proteobacteria bacterium]|nr:PilW family protein [Pseudomonadota bacterium]